MRIERKDLNWGQFYSNHPYSYFFSTLLEIDNVYLEDFYGELKKRGDAKGVNSSGLYYYSWEFWSVEDMVGTYDNDRKRYSNIVDVDGDPFYYIIWPLTALPLTTAISMTFNGSRIDTSDTASIHFVDYYDYVSGRQWFALKIPKASMLIVYKNANEEKKIIRGDVTQKGIWLVDYYKDENYIEDHFGKLVNVMIDKSLYTNNSVDPNIQSRIFAVHDAYSELMKDIILTMLNGHPSPGNLLKIAKSIVENYALTNMINKTINPLSADTAVEITDRVIGNWSDIERRSLFLIKYEMQNPNGTIREKLFDVMSRMIAYFKPIFTWCGLVSSSEYGSDPGDMTFDDSISEDEISLAMQEYITAVVMMPSFKGGANLLSGETFSAIDDEVEIIYVPEFAKTGVS